VVKVSAFAATLREEIALSTMLKESSAWQGALQSQTKHCNTTCCIKNNFQLFIKFSTFSYVAVMPWPRGIQGASYYYSWKSKYKDTSNKVIVKSILGGLVPTFLNIHLKPIHYTPSSIKGREIGPNNFLVLYCKAYPS
jgi:hypothetical protein